MSSMICRSRQNIITNFIAHTYTLFKGLEFAGGQRIGLANHGDYIDTGRQAAHQLDVDFTQTIIASKYNLKKEHKYIRVASGSDKVEKGVDPVVAEARITLDTRLFSQNIIVLTLDVASDFSKTKMGNSQLCVQKGRGCHNSTHVNSLSILSPKPGVSTIVKEMRTPSSSSSTLFHSQSSVTQKWKAPLLTDIDGLDSDSLFDVSSVWIIADLVGDDLGFTKGIDEGRTSRPRRTLKEFFVSQTAEHKTEGILTNNHDGKLDALLHVLSARGHFLRRYMLSRNRSKSGLGHLAPSV